MSSDQSGEVSVTSTLSGIDICPSFLRGMTIIGNFAVACISKARDGHSFGDLKLTENLTAVVSDARCGVVVIDLTSVNILHWLRFEGVVEELFGVTAMLGVLQPRAVGFKSDEIARTVSLPPTAT